MHFQTGRLSLLFVCFLDSLLRVEPAQRMSVAELLEHKWLNEGAVPDVPLDSPSIIVADEVSFCFLDF